MASSPGFNHSYLSCGSEKSHLFSDFPQLWTILFPTFFLFAMGTLDVTTLDDLWCLFSFHLSVAGNGCVLVWVMAFPGIRALVISDNKL
jgi:hypothetical protein